MLHSPNLTAASSLDSPNHRYGKAGSLSPKHSHPKNFSTFFRTNLHNFTAQHWSIFEKIQCRLIYKTNILSILDTIVLANIAILLPSRNSLTLWKPTALNELLRGCDHQMTTKSTWYQPKGAGMPRTTLPTSPSALLVRKSQCLRLLVPCWLISAFILNY